MDNADPNNTIFARGDRRLSFVCAGGWLPVVTSGGPMFALALGYLPDGARVSYVLAPDESGCYHVWRRAAAVVTPDVQPLNDGWEVITVVSQQGPRAPSHRYELTDEQRQRHFERVLRDIGGVAPLPPDLYGELVQGYFLWMYAMQALAETYAPTTRTLPDDDERVRKWNNLHINVVARLLGPAIARTFSSSLWDRLADPATGGVSALRIFGALGAARGDLMRLHPEAKWNPSAIDFMRRGAAESIMRLRGSDTEGVAFEQWQRTVKERESDILTMMDRLEALAADVGSGRKPLKWCQPRAVLVESPPRFDAPSGICAFPIQDSDPARTLDPGEELMREEARDRRDTLMVATVAAVRNAIGMRRAKAPTKRGGLPVKVARRWLEEYSLTPVKERSEKLRVIAAREGLSRKDAESLRRVLARELEAVKSALHEYREAYCELFDDGATA